LLLLEAVGWWPNPALVLTAGALAFGTAALTDSSKPGPLAALMDPNVDRPSRLRLILGVALLFGGLSIFITSIGPVFQFVVRHEPETQVEHPSEPPDHEKDQECGSHICVGYAKGVG